MRRFATKIVKESTRLGSLVTELIALSRLTGAEGTGSTFTMCLPARGVAATPGPAAIVSGELEDR